MYIITPAAALDNHNLCLFVVNIFACPLQISLMPLQIFVLVLLAIGFCRWATRRLGNLVEQANVPSERSLWHPTTCQQAQIQRLFWKQIQSLQNAQIQRQTMVAQALSSLPTNTKIVLVTNTIIARDTNANKNSSGIDNQLHKMT